MITTRARVGRSVGSVIALGVLEEGGEGAGGEAGRGALEAFHRPPPEVVFDRARGVLDRAPQGPAVHADQAEEPGPGDLAAAWPLVVGGYEGGQGVAVEVGLGRDVAELEAGVVVAGQLVVDQPDPVA